MTTGLALHLIDKTLPNVIKRKHPRKGEKKTRGKDQSLGKQTAQKR
jgi:hypothetical protein